MNITARHRTTAAEISNQAYAPALTPRTTPRCRILAAASCALIVLGISACGSESTVDNAPGSTETTVPSVSSAAPAPSTSAAANSPAAPAGEPAPEDAEPAVQDSGAEEVTSVPADSQRSTEDQEFLQALENNGVDLSREQGATQPGGVQDQVIAAARGYCSSKAEGKTDVFTALAAGQLQAQRIVDKSPEEIQKYIKDAADSAYCP